MINPKIIENKSLIKKAFQYIKSILIGKKLILMIFAFTLMIIVSFAITYVPVLLGKIVDSVILNDITSFESIKNYLIVIAILLIGSELLILIRKYIVENIATQLEKNEFVKISKHILSVDLQALNTERIGALNVKIHRSIEGVISILKLIFIEILPTFMITLVAIYIISTTNIYVSIVTIVVLIISIIVTFNQIKSQANIRVKIFRAKEDMGAKNSELLLGIEYVKSSGAIPMEINKVEKLAENLREKEFTHHKYMMTYDSAKMLIEILGLIFVISLSSLLAIEGEVSKGDVLTLAMLYSSVTVPLRSLNRFLDEGFEAILKIGDLLNTYAKPLDIGLLGKEEPLIDDGIIIDCRNVSYVLDNKVILDDINLQIRKGEKIGIAGSSGSGKSTLIKIVLGLNYHYNGNLKVFNKEVKDINKLSLSRLISYVSQNPFIIKGTIKDNVIYPHNEDIEEHVIMRAIKLSKIDELLESSSLGLNKNIEEQGKNISGGEKQRLALSRLFLPNDSEIIIMDEATSALDSINQENIQKAVNSNNIEKTIIVIAHRLKTLQDMDKIIVFNQGKIAEVGKYEDLIKQNGIFKTLVDKEKH